MKREKDPQFRHLEAIVGAFVVVAVAAIVSTVVIVGMENDLFAEKYHLRLRSESGSGFTQGMPVKLSGFRIGRVRKISLDEQAKVVVRMRIDRKYRKWIRADSIATLLKEGLVGDSVLNISVGSPGSPMLSDDDFIAFTEEKGLGEMAREFSDSVKSVLLEVRGTVAYINDPKGDIKQTLANIRRLSANLEETRRNADSLLLTTTDGLGRVGPVMDNLAAAIDNVGRRLPSLLDRMEGTLSNTERISVEVRKAAEKAAPRVPHLLGGAEELVEDTDDVVKGVKRMWPFRKHIPPANERGIVPGDSHE
jgi:phospholipid/cholesterol/gamma-HCH transport system substrate-binding protein